MLVYSPRMAYKRAQIANPESDPRAIAMKYKYSISDGYISIKNVLHGKSHWKEDAEPSYPKNSYLCQYLQRLSVVHVIYA